MSNHSTLPTARPDMPEVAVYEPMSEERISFRAWPRMIREIRDYHELIFRLAGRNLSAQFRQSLLGYLWVALPPVATAFIFGLLRTANVVNVEMPAGSMPYVLFALLGSTTWGFFTQVAMMATNSIAGAGNLVSKVYFPREVLVLSSAGSAVINLAIRLVVVGITCLLLGYAPHWQAIFAPLLLLPVLVFGLGLGFLFAPVNAMVSDMSRVLEFAFQFGLFLAPIVYPTPPLDGGGAGWQVALHWLHTLNPVSHFIYAINDLVQQGAFTLTFGLVSATVISVLTLAIGWRCFHIGEPLMAERL